MGDDWRDWMAEADEKARLEYSKDLGILEVALRMLKSGITATEVADLFDYDLEIFKKIIEKDVIVEELAVELVEKLQKGRDL
ncbi:hypothetical protein NLX67_20420 [Domibacillus sp. A3M-37]|uniref:hypothetical protein n=1 Tax=Domibacillus sp. A3M-37 TaxID=2962037 RepID=UPI0020B69FFE|nr:hypothetical protein [Domibacillus sp. A3M-37]MCP3764704.1 hypothetical protein [Domibacillus sp. A3M-37]